MRSESAEDGRATRWRRGTLQVGLLLTGLAAVLGLAADHHWLAFFLDQPRPHYAVVLAVGLVPLVLRRRWRSALLCAVALGLDVWCLLPALQTTPMDDAVRAESTVSVVHANLGRSSAPSAALIGFVAATRADVLLFQEVTPQLLEAADRAFPRYRLVESEPRDDTRGVAAFAAAGLRVRESSLERFAADVTDRPCVSLTLELPAGPLTLLGFHAKRPQDASTIGVQAAEYRGLADWFRKQTDVAAVAIGDFNATPWSRRVHGLLRAAGLPAVQDGFSLRPTWPAGPFLPLGLPIDLAVHGGAARIVESATGPDVGSDHRPLLCRVAVLTSRP